MMAIKEAHKLIFDFKTYTVDGFATSLLAIVVPTKSDSDVIFCFNSDSC